MDNAFETDTTRGERTTMTMDDGDLTSFMAALDNPSIKREDLALLGFGGGDGRFEGRGGVGGGGGNHGKVGTLSRRMMSPFETTNGSNPPDNNTTTIKTTAGGSGVTKTESSRTTETQVQHTTIKRQYEVIKHPDGTEIKRIIGETTETKDGKIKDITVDKDGEISRNMIIEGSFPNPAGASASNSNGNNLVISSSSNGFELTEPSSTAGFLTTDNGAIGGDREPPHQNMNTTTVSVQNPDDLLNNSEFGQMLRETRRHFDDMLNSKKSAFAAQYSDIFRDFNQNKHGGGEDDNNFEEESYTDGNGVTHTVRRRRQEQSFHMQTRTVTCNGKTMSKTRRAYIKKDLNGQNVLTMEEDQDWESETEDDLSSQASSTALSTVSSSTPSVTATMTIISGGESGAATITLGKEGKLHGASVKSGKKVNRAQSLISEIQSTSGSVEEAGDWVIPVDDLQNSDKPKLSGAKKASEKAWFAVKELVDTEERYVRKLHLLDQEFRKRVEEANQKENFLSRENKAKLFANMSSIYDFHNEYFLPILLERRRDWHSTGIISDCIVQYAPYLKMYSEYTTNHERANRVFEETFKRSKTFASIVRDVQKNVECDNLELRQQLIIPVQRIMKYHLLLDQYLKQLDDQHPDRKKTEEAVIATREGAEHANKMMKKIESYKTVMSVVDQLGGTVPGLVTPSRELVKEGFITKISAKTGAKESRKLFLFNDILLMCSPRKVSTKFRCRAFFNNKDLQVVEGDRLDLLHTFYVRGGTIQTEFCAGTAAEKLKWMSAFVQAIKDSNDRASTFISTDTKAAAPESGPDQGQLETQVLSEPANSRVQEIPSNNDKSKCAICKSGFSMFRRKQKTCPKCERTICSQCRSSSSSSSSNLTTSTNSQQPSNPTLSSSDTVPKSLTHNKKQRVKVCLDCSATAMTKSVTTNSTTTSTKSITKTTKTMDPGLSAAPAGINYKPNHQPSTSTCSNCPETDALVEGYVELSSKLEKEWKRRYLALHRDFVLYMLQSDTDNTVLTSLPVSGTSVRNLEGSRSSSNESTFLLTHLNREYSIRVNDNDTLLKWMALLSLSASESLPAAA